MIFLRSTRRLGSATVKTLLVYSAFLTTLLLITGCGPKTVVIPGDKVVRFVPDGHCQPCHAGSYDGYGIAGRAWFRERYRAERELVERLREVEDR